MKDDGWYKTEGGVFVPSKPKPGRDMARRFESEVKIVGFRAPAKGGEYFSDPSNPILGHDR